ncbi:MAG: cytidine deaminase [Methylocystis sp.]|nr:cytidine deaminase [Methylocystis sp.]MBI3274719.1 cytidine deaminase [Methylocystis sp.]
MNGKQKILTLSDLSPVDRRLCEKARNVAQNAYAPYSGFAVGAAVRTPSGGIVCGTNFENASYGLSICAEMAAIASANSSGESRIAAIAVAGYKFAPEPKIIGIVTPCGRCRQIIWEAGSSTKEHVKVFCCNGDLSQIVVYGIEELLPDAFDGDELQRFRLEKRAAEDVPQSIENMNATASRKRVC